MSQLPDQTIDPLPPEPAPLETPPVDDVAPDVVPPAQEVSGAKWYTLAFLVVISLLSLGGSCCSSGERGD